VPDRALLAVHVPERRLHLLEARGEAAHGLAHLLQGLRLLRQRLGLLLILLQKFKIWFCNVQS
jgi:hypothetical protein